MHAAWDLAHVIALTLVDEEFGKAQLDLMLQASTCIRTADRPTNGPAINPPVHAWSTISYRLEQPGAASDAVWLERSFQKLLLNLAWWVNRKDRSGNNVFEGGFLGLDNIGVFDRSSPAGGYSSRPTAPRGWRLLPEHAGNCRGIRRRTAGA